MPRSEFLPANEDFTFINHPDIFPSATPLQDRPMTMPPRGAATIQRLPTSPAPRRLHGNHGVTIIREVRLGSLARPVVLGTKRDHSLRPAFEHITRSCYSTCGHFIERASLSLTNEIAPTRGCRAWHTLVCPRTRVHAVSRLRARPLQMACRQILRT